MLWSGGEPAIIGGHDPGRLGPVGNLKLLVKLPKVKYTQSRILYA